jgi:hypothetical protein
MRVPGSYSGVAYAKEQSGGSSELLVLDLCGSCRSSDDQVCSLTQQNHLDRDGWHLLILKAGNVPGRPLLADKNATRTCG